jgi:hypothetical protein
MRQTGEDSPTSNRLLTWHLTDREFSAQKRANMILKKGLACSQKGSKEENKGERSREWYRDHHTWQR